MTISLQLPQKQSLLDRARADVPHWAGERIRAWPEPDYQACRPFTRRRYWCNHASLNVFQVIGTQHPAYVGLTWLQFLEHGRRMPGNLALHRENPGYYLDTEPKKPVMYFETLDGHDYYVAGDGNHRTCIARFMAFYDYRCILHGVNVTQREIAWDLLAVWRHLREVVAERRIALSLEMHQRTVGRQDTAGWMQETYDVRLRVRWGDRFGLLDTRDALAFLQTLQAPRWRLWFAIRRGLPPVAPACAGS